MISARWGRHDCIMRILCFIDNLGAGGAQRQLVGLAKLLARRNYDIIVAYYQDNLFFEKELTDHGIGSFLIPLSNNKIKNFFKIFNYIKSIRPQVLISYLETPSMLVCAFRLLGLRYKLIVSERNTNVKYTFRDRIRFQLFRVANYVVPNSYSQQQFLEKRCPFLRSKIVTITNFCSFLDYTVERKQKRDVPEIVIAASIWASKNTVGFIEAVNILKNKGAKFHVSWYGIYEDSPYLKRCVELINSLRLENTICLLDKTKNIKEVYEKADFFCLPSFYEGTPNVICEAICMSLPVICSDVCDNSFFVHEGENGLLFNPNSPEDIADKLWRAISIDDIAYYAYCKNSRIIAEKLLSEDKFVEKYIRLIAHE